MNVIALASGCGVAAKVTSELFGVDFALVLLEVSQAVEQNSKVSFYLIFALDLN